MLCFSVMTLTGRYTKPTSFFLQLKFGLRIEGPCVGDIRGLYFSGVSPVAMGHPVVLILDGSYNGIFVLEPTGVGSSRAIAAQNTHVAHAVLASSTCVFLWLGFDLLWVPVISIHFVFPVFQAMCILWQSLKCFSARFKCFKAYHHEKFTNCLSNEVNRWRKSVHCVFSRASLCIFSEDVDSLCSWFCVPSGVCSV